MTGKERTLAAMNSQPVDRVPVSFYTHVAPGDDNGYTNYTTWMKNTDMDMLCMEPDPYYGLQYPEPLVTMDDYLAIRPYKKTDRYITDQVERAARLSEALPDKATYYMIFTPFAILKDTVRKGQTGNMILWNAGHDKCKQVMNILEENNWLLMDELKAKTGITGIFTSMQSGEKWRFSPDDYKEHLAPYDKRIIAKMNDMYENNIVHMCSWGNEPNNIDNWVDYDYKTVNWGVYQEEDLSLSKARTYFKPGTCLMGGFDRLPEGVLFRGRKGEIKAETKRMIEEAGSTGYIISSDCSIMENTPDSHIRWVIEAAEEYAAGIY